MQLRTEVRPCMCFLYIRTSLGPELSVSQQRPSPDLSTYLAGSLPYFPESCQVSHASPQPIFTPLGMRQDREKKDLWEHGGGNKAPCSGIWFVSCRLTALKTQTVHRGNVLSSLEAVTGPPSGLLGLLSHPALNSTLHGTTAQVHFKGQAVGELSKPAHTLHLNFNQGVFKSCCK